jgi:hypothetical protein
MRLAAPHMLTYANVCGCTLAYADVCCVRLDVACSPLRIALLVLLAQKYKFWQNMCAGGSVARAIGRMLA